MREHEDRRETTRRLRARRPRAGRDRGARAPPARCETCREHLRWLDPAPRCSPSRWSRWSRRPQLRERVMAEVAEPMRRGGQPADEPRSGAGPRLRRWAGDRRWLRSRSSRPGSAATRSRATARTAAATDELAQASATRGRPDQRRASSTRATPAPCSSPASRSCRWAQVYQAWVQHGEGIDALLAVRGPQRRHGERGHPARGPRRGRRRDGHGRATAAAAPSRLGAARQPPLRLSPCAAAARSR